MGLRKSIRGTLVVKQDSWHGKMYMFWRRHGYFKKYSYKENLCHYCRVVLFWGPWQWLKNGKNENSTVKPWMIVLAPLALFGLYYGLKYETRLTWILLGSALVLGVAVGALIGLGMFLADHNTALHRFFSALGEGFMKFGRMMKRFGRWTKPGFVAFGKWFAHAHVLKVVYPWTVATVAIITAALIYDPLSSLMFLGVVAAVGVVIVGLVAVGLYLGDRHDKALNAYMEENEYTYRWDAERAMKAARKNRRFRRGVRKFFVGFADGVMLIVRFVVAKKHGICPFIEIEQDNAEAA